MSSIEYCTILRYLLMTPLFSTDEVFPIFFKVNLNTFGEHTVHCRELPGFKYQYDFVRDVLFNIFRGECIHEEKGDCEFFGRPIGGKINT